MNDNQTDTDRRLREMLSDAIIRPGVRPRTNDEIEAMLEAFGGDEFSDRELDRILLKARGELPLGHSTVQRLADEPAQDEARELLALHRAEGTEISEEIKKRLEEIRRQAVRDAEKRNEDTDEFGD